MSGRMTRERKRTGLLVVLAVGAGLVLCSRPVRAATFEPGGRQLQVLGFFTQSVMWGLGSDEDFDTRPGLQSLLTSVLVEGEYRPAPDLKLFASGLLVTDRIYDVRHGQRQWTGKGFNRSRRELAFDDEYWQLLKELHLSWFCGRFFFRAGKQIVSWGETIGVRLMDRINPLDQRRGFSDVEFETTIIPIWLVRAEYYPDVGNAWLSDVGIECVFNPNADFIPEQLLSPGNDAAGIWAPDVPLGTVAGRRLRLGSLRARLDEPGEWDSEGFELGVRVKAMVGRSLVTLNYFNGIANEPVTRPVTGAAAALERACDGSLLVHPAVAGHYPDQRFFGVTLNRDLQNLRARVLGNISPVLRLEALYGFDTTFATDEGPPVRRDEVHWAIGLDWKVKIDALNPRACFTVSPQFFHRRIIGYPSGKTLTDLRRNNCSGSLYIATSYLNAKLVPSLFWLRDQTRKADMLRMQVDYVRSHHWIFRTGVMLFSGSHPGGSFRAFSHKDHVYVSVSYRWG